ncbi:MAG: glycosyltransferase family 4 protein [Clostridiales bacterium]|nr:glycosyltransferase family 4 protein [Clostridiales bacterium]
MKDIVFVLNIGCYPVPAIKGGAVESLLTALIDENEKQKKFNFHVIMCKDKNDITQYDYSSYQNTKFYDYYQGGLKFKIGRIVNGVNKRLNYALPLYSAYEKFIIKTIDKINPDFMVFEGSFNATLRKLSKKYDKDKLILHVHHQILPKYKIDKYFGRMWCVSEFIKNDWIASKKLSPDFKYQVLNNVLTSYSFYNEISKEEIKDLREKLGFADDDFVVIYCGRLVEVKGIDILVKAIKEIDNEHIKLMVVGESGFKDSKPQPFIQTLKDIVCNDDKIVFTGYVENKDLYKYYSIADLQVIPSVWEEAAGIVALEGKVRGLPQIITNSGGLPEYARKDAVVLDKEDNLQQNLVKEISNFYNRKYDFDKTKAFAPSVKEYYEQFIKIIEE